MKLPEQEAGRSVAWWTRWLEVDQVLLQTFLVVLWWKEDLVYSSHSQQGLKMQQSTPRSRVRKRAEKAPKLSRFDSAEHSPTFVPTPSTWICVGLAWPYLPMSWEDNPFFTLILPLKIPVIWQRSRNLNKNINISKKNNVIFMLLKTLSFYTRV